MQAVAEAIAKERTSIAAFLKAACDQAPPQQAPASNGFTDQRGQQRRSSSGAEPRGPQALLGQRRRHSLDQQQQQDANGFRSRLGDQGLPVGQGQALHCR